MSESGPLVGDAVSAGPAPPVGVVPPDDGHVWISLSDVEGDVWLFDATFLLSSQQCIYGMGCPSIDVDVDPTGALGCCIHGAHFVDDDDRADVAAAAALLTDDNWQYRRRATKKGGPFKKNRDGDWVTRKADGACIFLNRADFDGGAGCALHRAALERGERPLDWKPDVCWQVPIRLDVHTDDNKHDTVFIRAWERRDWGAGGDDFHWWCIEEPSSYSAATPLVDTSRDELIEMVGEDMYDRLRSELAKIRTGTPVELIAKPT